MDMVKEFAEKLSRMKDTVETGKTETTRALTQKESLQQQRQEIASDLAEISVTLEGLSDEIETLTGVIKQKIEEAEKALLMMVGD